MQHIWHWYPSHPGYLTHHHLGGFTYVASIKGCHHDFVSWLQVHCTGLNVFWLCSGRAAQTSKLYLLATYWCRGQWKIQRYPDRGLFVILSSFFLNPCKSSLSFWPVTSFICTDNGQIYNLANLQRYFYPEPYRNPRKTVFLAFGCIGKRLLFHQEVAFPSNELGTSLLSASPYDPKLEDIATADDKHRFRIFFPASINFHFICIMVVEAVSVSIVVLQLWEWVRVKFFPRTAHLWFFAGVAILNTVILMLLPLWGAEAYLLQWQDVKFPAKGNVLPAEDEFSGVHCY